MLRCVVLFGCLVQCVSLFVCLFLRLFVHFVLLCCHVLCCPVPWTICLLFEAFDLPQWFHIFSARRYFKHFCRFEALLGVEKRCSLKSAKVLEKATRSKNDETIVEGHKASNNRHHEKYVFQTAFLCEK